MNRIEITVWITYEEDEDLGPSASARKVLEELRIPGLVKGETVNGLAFEWDARVLGPAETRAT